MGGANVGNILDTVLTPGQNVAGLWKPITADFDDTQADTIIWTPASGRRIVVMGLKFSTNATPNSWYLGSLDGVTQSKLSGTQYEAANGGNPWPQGPIWILEPDAKLTFSCSGAGILCSITVWGFEL